MDTPLLFLCDETSHRGHQFAAVGGFCCRLERMARINAEIEAIRDLHGYRSEIKWERVSRHHIKFYEHLVVYFFSLIRTNGLHFHVVICDFNEYDHRRHNGGRKQVSVSKTYYQLILHRCCRLYGSCNLYIRPDGGDCTASLPRFRDALNADSYRRFGSRPIRGIDLIPKSEHFNALGLNDLILGSIASHRNQRHNRPAASPHKARIAALILEQFKLRDYTQDTPYEGRKWTIWNWEPQPEK